MAQSRPFLMFIKNPFLISKATTLLFVITAATIMSFQLFAHPIIGIADNTDFRRISTQVGIHPASGPTTLFKYTHLQFKFGEPKCIEYASTELLFCKIAKTINQTFFSREVFDIRFLGLTHVAVFTVALFIFGSGIRLRAIPKFIFLASCLFLLVDDRIISYFNTFYSESSSVIFLLLTVGTMLAFYAENPTRLRLWVNFLSFLGCSLLLAFSKSQHLVMLFPLWCFGVCVARELIRSLAWRWVWALATILLMLGGLWFGINSRAYAATKNTNIRIVLTTEIKPNSPDYVKDLRQMHATKNDISRVTLGRIGLFYARHPIRYLELLERRASKAFQHISYGCFSESESNCGWEQSSKFNYWWSFKAAHYPKKLWFILGVLVVGAFLGVHQYFKAPVSWQSHIGLVTTTLSFMTVGAFVVAATFEANGSEKHLFLFNVLFDLVTAFSILLAMTLFKCLRDACTPHSA